MGRRRAVAILGLLRLAGATTEAALVAKGVAVEGDAVMVMVTKEELRTINKNWRKWF